MSKEGFLFIILMVSIGLNQYCNKVDRNNSNKISGKWRVGDSESFFTSMELSDSTAIVYTRGDTVLHLKFNLKDDVLYFFDPGENGLLYQDPVITLNDSILVFKTFLNEPYEHQFSREKDICGTWQNVSSVAKYKWVRIAADGKMYLFQNATDSLLMDYNYTNGVIISVSEKLPSSFADTVMNSANDTLALKTLCDIKELQRSRKIQ